MKTVLAAAILLAAMASAQAKEWSQMNGHERRLYVISYIRSNGLHCERAPGSVKDQETKLEGIPWVLVWGGLKKFCSSGPVEQRVQTSAPKKKIVREIVLERQIEQRTALENKPLQKISAVAPVKRMIEQSAAAGQQDAAPDPETDQGMELQPKMASLNPSDKVIKTPAPKPLVQSPDYTFHPGMDYYPTEAEQSVRAAEEDAVKAGLVCLPYNRFQ